MNKKKMVIMAATLIVAAATVAGGTLAYFTHSVEVVNVLTTGKVEIALEEKTYIPANSSNITPGRVIPKDPTITNTGSNDCYLRVKLEATLTDKAGNPSELPVTAEQLVNLLPGWTQGVGATDKDYYYYNTKLAPKAAATVFTSMTVPQKWGNAYQGLTLNLKVIAHAVQADNFTPITAPVTKEIVGWNGIAVEK